MLKGPLPTGSLGTSYTSRQLTSLVTNNTVPLRANQDLQAC